MNQERMSRMVYNYPYTRTSMNNKGVNMPYYTQPSIPVLGRKTRREKENKDAYDYWVCANSKCGFNRNYLTNRVCYKCKTGRMADQSAEMQSRPEYSPRENLEENFRVKKYGKSNYSKNENFTNTHPIMSPVPTRTMIIPKDSTIITEHSYTEVECAIKFLNTIKNVSKDKLFQLIKSLQDESESSTETK